MAGKMILVAAALAVIFSYAMPTGEAKAADRKTCVAQCKKTNGPGRGMTKCVNNCMAAN